MSLGSFSLDYVNDVSLRAQGLLEATFDNSVPSSAGPFGVIWKASQADGEDFYFAQVGFNLLIVPLSCATVPILSLLCTSVLGDYCSTIHTWLSNHW